MFWDWIAVGCGSFLTVVAFIGVVYTAHHQ